MFNSHKRHIFTPDKLGNQLRFWITARDITIDGKPSLIKDGSNNVSQMYDLSQFNNHVIQGTGALQPLWEDGQMGSNNLPLINFDGTQYLHCDGMIADDVFYNNTVADAYGSIFIVYEHSADTQNRLFGLGRSDGSTVRQFYVGCDNATGTAGGIVKNRIGLRNRGSSNAFTISSNETDLTDQQQLVAECNKPGPILERVFYINDDFDGNAPNDDPVYVFPTGGSWFNASFGTNAPTDIGIGAWVRGSDATFVASSFPIKISEIIVTHQTTNRSREDITTYLRKSYGL